MGFFDSAITILQTLVVALGAGLEIWGLSIFWKGTEMIIPVRMLMFGKEATNKTDKDRRLLFRK